MSLHAPPLPCARWVVFLETPSIHSPSCPLQGPGISPPSSRWRVGVPCFGRSGVAQAASCASFWSRQDVGRCLPCARTDSNPQSKGGGRGGSWPAHTAATASPNASVEGCSFAILDMHLEDKDRLAIGTLVHVNQRVHCHSLTFLVCMYVCLCVIVLFCGFVSSIRDTPAQFIHVDQTLFAFMLLKEDSQISLCFSLSLSLSGPCDHPFPLSS